jgi:predicted RNase H-like HicB family nuclease
MPRLIDVKFGLQGAIREDKDTDSFVSYCPALDLHSAGRTRVEAKKALQSAIDMYVRICYQRNILGRIFHEKGFMVAASSAAGAATEAITEFVEITEALHGEKYDDVFAVEVPLHLIASQAKGMGVCLQ